MNQNYQEKVFRDYTHSEKYFLFIYLVGLLDQLIVLMKGVLVQKISVLVTHLKIFFIRILKNGYITEIITETTPFCCLCADLHRLVYLIKETCIFGFCFFFFSFFINQVKEPMGDHYHKKAPLSTHC